MTEDKLLGHLGKWGEKLLAWILCAVLMSAVIYIYLESTVNIYSAAAALLSAGLILLFDFIRSKKFSGLVYTAILICICFVPKLLIGSNINSFMGFVKWFFSGAQAEETRLSYILTLTILMCFFLTSAVYYFTHVIYRSVMMLLVTLIPFALSVKAVVALPYAYSATAAAVNILLFLCDARKNLLKASKLSGKSALMVYTDFAAASIFLALLIPKPSVTPYYEKFEAIANRFQFGGSGETYYEGEYRKLSGNADNYLKGESRLLYIVSTNTPVYMKYQVFDIYDSEQRGWVQLEELTGSKSWQDSAPLLSYEKLAEALSETAEKDSELYYYYPQGEKLSELTEKESYSIVYAQNFPSAYVLSPLRAISASLADTGASYSARSDSGEIFTDIYLPANANYTVRYYSEDISKTLMRNGFCDVGIDEYGYFLADASLSSDHNKVIAKFLAQNVNAKEYKEKTETEVSEEIKALADEITAGLEYDYQKAQAIEKYFLTGEYIYSLAYEAPKELDTPEYFIFQSKTGTCSDFATAYTLIARAAGLSVRYVEGFVPQMSENNRYLYYIYTDNAHAYPEVYIPGAGWVQFEPTPPDYTAVNAAENENTDETNYLAVFMTAVVLVCSLTAFVLLVIFTPKIAEGIFIAHVKLSDNSKAVIILYNRHAKNIEARFGESCKAFTPEQLAEYTETKTGISLAPIIKPFITACYGGNEISAGEKLSALECYKIQKKEMRRKKKKRKE